MTSSRIGLSPSELMHQNERIDQLLNELGAGLPHEPVIKPGEPIPAWVWDLPLTEPTRQRLELIEMLGPRETPLHDTAVDRRRR